MAALATSAQGLGEAAALLWAIGDVQVLLRARREADTELDLAAQAIADLEMRVPKELERAVAEVEADLKGYGQDLRNSQDDRVNNATADAKAESALETARTALQEAQDVIEKLAATSEEMADRQAAA